MMLELTMEHAQARRTVNKLETSKETYIAGKVDALQDILQTLKTLIELYPTHIEKEDKHFFLPSMTYFARPEQDEMLNKFIDFNRDFTDKKYLQVIAALES